MDSNITSYIKAINGQAQAAQNTITKLSQKVRKYDPALSSKAPKGFHGTWSKVKCELLAVILNQDEGRRAWLESTSQATASHFANMQNYITTLQSTLLQHQGDFQAHISNSMASLNLEWTKFSEDVAVTKERDLEAILSQGLRNQLDHWGDHLQSLIQKQHEQVLLRLPDVQTNIKGKKPSIAGVGPARGSGGLRNRLNQSETATSGDRHVMPQVGDLVPGTCKSDISGGSVLRQKNILLVEWLTQFAETILQVLPCILLILPRLQQLIRTVQALPRSPTYLLQDNIRFEDVLGQTHSLQWTYFRHWRVR